MKKLIFGLSLLFGFSANSQTLNVPMYSVGPFSTNLEIVDTNTMTVISTLPLNSDIGPVNGCNGGAIQPCSGDFYVCFQAGGNRNIGILDPTTGFITSVGVLAEFLSTIAFRSYDELVGISGSTATSESLWDVSIVDATMGLASALGPHDDGEGMAYCPDNDHYYRASGWGSGSTIFEKINPTTYAQTNITKSGYAWNNGADFVYWGNGMFLGGDAWTGQHFMIDTNGVATGPITGLPGDKKGMGFPLRWIDAATTTICDGGGFTPIYATQGDGYEWFLDGSTTGITTSFILADTPGDYSCMITIDSCTYSSNTITMTSVVGTPPTVTITPNGDTLYCPVMPDIVLTGSLETTHQWLYNGDLWAGATTNVVNANMIGSYNMIATDAAGCSDTAAVGVNLIPPPTATISPLGPELFCTGDSLMLTASSGFDSYEWLIDGTPIAGATSDTYYTSASGTYTVIGFLGPCSDTLMTGVVVTEDACLGISVNEKEIESKVYPNPAGDLVTIKVFKALSNTHIQITTVEGKVLYENNYTQQGLLTATVDLSGLEGGIYLVRILNEQGSSTHRLIKQ